MDQDAHCMITEEPFVNFRNNPITTAEDSTHSYPVTWAPPGYSVALLRGIWPRKKNYVGRKYMDALVTMWFWQRNTTHADLWWAEVLTIAIMMYII
jgi:hypothetical protein